ncbi:MAG: hypothetical protein ISP70_04630 [Crocinitomicaceae bacterium]|nr:hypothetical protein [Crocinitomicaceae bacterium]
MKLNPIFCLFCPEINILFASYGMAVQMGKVNGAELILLSREKNNALSNDRLFPAIDKLIEDGPIIKAIFEDETPGNQSQLNLYSHLALFVIKI